MSEEKTVKEFSSLNGYRVKDATARDEIKKMKEENANAKLYQHNVRIQFYRDDLGSEMEREFFDFQFPSSSANKIEGTFDNSTSAFSLIPDNKYLGGWGDYANSEFGGDGIIIKIQDLFYAMGYSVTCLNINTYITFITDLNSLSGDPITRIVVTDDVKEI